MGGCQLYKRLIFGYNACNYTTSSQKQGQIGWKMIDNQVSVHPIAQRLPL
jgi:hypothetical protein